MCKTIVIYQKEKEAIIAQILLLISQKGFSKNFLIKATRKQRSSLNKCLKGCKNMKLDTLFMLLGAIDCSFDELSASPALCGKIRNLVDEEHFVNEHNYAVRLQQGNSQTL